MSRSNIYICGLGAVSPAGWGVPALRAALNKGEPLPLQSLDRPAGLSPVRARLVPSPAARPGFLAHPRLRRTSPITHYSAAAALEALATAPALRDSKLRLGLVVSLQTGCVHYCCRFYDETLRDPATASPLLFPETVFAAPASHVATLLENVTLAYTLVGDPSAFLQAVALGVQWLEEGRVDASLIIGAEETHWILADALWHLERDAVFTGGAGALCLSRDPHLSVGVQLAAITDPHTYSARLPRARAARAMRLQLDGSATDLLSDGLGGGARANAPEADAWQDWTGPRLSLKRVLGEGLMAAAAWQCVAACDAVVGGRFTAANVSLVGGSQQAIGARFVASGILPAATA
jgi:3-oxoacyl-[acyl-carrier-protein] synthase II